MLGTKRFSSQIKTWLSHHPLLYALIGGVGVVLFWRGVWHFMDYLMLLAQSSTAHTSIDLTANLWWDGPLSLVIGSFILLSTSAFVFSLIGNEIIISGLQAEKRQLAKTGGIIHSESQEIDELRQAFSNISTKLQHLECAVNKKQISPTKPAIRADKLSK